MPAAAKKPAATPPVDPEGTGEPTDQTDQVEEQDKPITVEVGGHEYTIDPASRDDFELLDDLNEMTQSGDIHRTPAILRRMLGREQARLVMNRLRDEETGRVSIDAGSDFVLALLDGLNPN